MKLTPKSYTLKRSEYPHMNFPEGRQIGLIAQEVEQVIPELVEESVHPGPNDPATGKPGKTMEHYRAMNYIGLTPVLVGAIQEQQKIIEAQKKQIDEMEKRIQALENK